MKKKNTSLYLTALLAVAILIGIGYAALSATLNINGQTKISKTTWDVHFENASTNDSEAIKFYAASDTSFSSPLTNINETATTTLNYSVTFTGPDATADTTHNMTVDVVNKGTLDATISSVTLPSQLADNGSLNTSAISHLVTESCTWSDGSTIQIGDVITAGSSKTIVCKHHYKSASELTSDYLSEAWNNVSGDTVSRDFSVILNFTAE